jgi:LmbE family N-acetylglucosaminyl deacetylase
MSEPLTLMAVHAHPDDEASSGGILAAYADQGIRTVVVTCTNGEYGDAPGGIKPGQPGHDPDAVARQRLAELDQSVKILKVSDLETLGYHDSGMEEWDYKSRPEAFSNVPIATVAARIADLITKYRPQVLVTYDDQGAYQHPGQGLPVDDAGLELAQDLGRAARGGRGSARLAGGRGARPPGA